MRGCFGEKNIFCSILHSLHMEHCSAETLTPTLTLTLTLTLTPTVTLTRIGLRSLHMEHCSAETKYGVQLYCGAREPPLTPRLFTLAQVACSYTAQQRSHLSRAAG